MANKNQPTNVVPLNTQQQQRQDSTVAGGGDGPYDSDMEVRVNKLERTCDDIISTLGRLEPAIIKIRDDTNEMKGKLSQMPTVWTLFALVISIFALAFLLVRFGLPHGT
jgi:hypothetical protein